MFWGLALLGATLVLNTMAGLNFTRREIQQSTAELQVETAAFTARHIHSFISHKIERLQDLALAMTLYPPGGAEQKLLAQLLLKNDAAFSELSILDNRGMELFKLAERKLYLSSDLTDRSSSAFFVEAVRGDLYVGPVYTSDRAEPYITLAVPLKLGPKTTLGILVGETNLKFLWEVIGRTSFGHDGYAYLVDHDGKLIAHKDASLVLKHISLKNLPKVAQFLRDPLRDSIPGEQGPGIAGEPVLSTFAPVPDLGWGVIVEEPLSLALSEVKKAEKHSFLLLIAGLSIGAGIIVWGSARITNPILQLRRGVQTIGVGNLHHRAEIKTGDEIEELADEFNKMADALGGFYATLEQKVALRTQEVSTLYEISSAVNQSLDLEAILQAVIKKTTDVFNFEATRIFLFNDRMDQLELRASFEVNPEHWTGLRVFKRRQGIVGGVAESGEPMIFEDVLTDPRYLALSSSKATQKAQLRFFAVFPIKTQSRVSGVVLFNGKDPRKLNNDEISLLTSMAEHLGVAVEKASLFKQVQTRSRHLSALNTVGEAVSRSLELEIVLKQAVEKITETLGFDAAWIYLLNAAGEELHLKAYKGLSEETAQFMAKRGLSGISGTVVTTGERLVFEDVRNDERYRALSAASQVSRLGFNASAVFPIKAKEKILGTLHVVNFATRHFASEELQLLESIAQEVGVGVENAQLFTEIKQKTSELVKMNEELQEASRAKSEFIAAMSHELRTPLNVIMGYSDLSADGFFGELNADLKGAMVNISRNARLLLKMVNDVLALSRMEAKKMSLDVETVEIGEILAHVEAYVKQLNRDKLLEIHWDIDQKLAPVVTDPVKLEEILQNLLGNAFKFTPKGYIGVRVRGLQEQDRVEFSVADSGIGIEANHLNKIFDAFEQLRDAHTGEYNGVGLGLSIVKKYLELMQGEIRVESELGQGSTFIFTIPRALQDSPRAAA